MKKLFLLIIGIILLTTSINLQAQTPGENFDVKHYDIYLWGFDFTEHTLQGKTFVKFSATAPTNTFVLELKSLTVTTVECSFISPSVDPVGCSFSQEGDLLIITTEETLGTGEMAGLLINYGGNTFSETWGGVEWWGDYVYNLGVGFDSQPHNLGKTWFPCVDNFTDKATYSINITIENDKKAICGGNLGGIDNMGDGTSTWRWEVPQEVATYHVSFAIGDYVLWEDTYHGIERDIPIEVYVKPTQINNVPGSFSHIHEIAAFYEENFAPYPFNRIGYVCTGKGCMEHIDNIAITPGIITGDNTQEEYLAHELSHMYFGNKVTCSTAGDMWLNEGFAQFCGVFYLADVYGEAEYQEEMSSKINSIVSWCGSEPNWIPLNNMPLDMTYDSKAVYDRGAVIINSMMNYMGRDNFLKGLRHYLNTYSYSTTTTEQLRDALTEATGIDMTGFFNTYVFVGGMPHYTVNIKETTANGNQFNTKLKLNYQHIGPSHVGQDNRVQVTFVGANGQLQTETAYWDGVEGEQTFTLDFEPIAAFADYNNQSLDAKFDKNMTATSPSSITVSKLQAKVNSVTDSVMLRVEGHTVAPDDDPEILGLTLSKSHYWNVLRLDFGNADVSGIFSFTLSTDGDIIQTENDSAVLLYRANIMDEWHTVPYTFEGNWKIGRFTVDNLQTGQYTIGAIDKSIGINENNMPTIQIYPNPSVGLLHIVTPYNDISTVEYRITNLTGQTLMTGMTQRQIDVSHLPSGNYFITINGNTSKFIIQ